MKFPIFSFPALKKKFSSHISSFCSKKRPAIKDFLHYAGVPLLFALSFLAGSAARVIVQHFSPPEAVATSSDCASWGLSFQEEGKRPVGNASIQELASYNAYFAKDTQEKILYLTFDCGYENGNTPLLLNALKKHNVKATFFVVGNFIRDNGDLIKEMVQEGHIVGNHTLSHPDMSGISSLNDFRKQLEGVENLYKETTGESMTKFYRPPQGITVQQICPWQRNWGIKPSSGVLPTWTGIRINSQLERKPLISFSHESTQGQLSCCTILLPQMDRFWMNC